MFLSNVCHVTVSVNSEKKKVLMDLFLNDYRDITSEFLVKSKFRDLNALCRVSVKFILFYVSAVYVVV